MLVWLVGGLLSLLGALTYGELSAVNPKAGGIYVHLRDCFGPLPAFLFGWTLFFAMNGGTVATLAVAFSTMLSQIVPLSAAMTKVVAVAMIAVTTFKCFLYDLRSLEGLYRVAAFVGLAISLALVSLALQKFVLASEKEHAT